MIYEGNEISRVQERYFGKRYEGASLKNVNPEIREQILQWCLNPKDSLVLNGPTGVGKTYAAAACLEYLLPNHLFYKITKENHLMMKLGCTHDEDGCNHKSYTTNMMLRHLHHTLNEDLLVLDDVGYSFVCDMRNILLEEILDYCHEKKILTIYCMDSYSKNHKNPYNSRILSRLFDERNCVVDFSGLPDLRRTGIPA